MSMIKKAPLFLATFFILVSAVSANTYVFVSHSMNDEALRSYFKEAQKMNATLVMRGLVNDSFMATKARCEKLKISYDINPVLFDDYAVRVVPTIISEDKKFIKKISGHIPLVEALRIFKEEQA